MDKIPYQEGNQHCKYTYDENVFKKSKMSIGDRNINANDLLHISSIFKAGIFVCDMIRGWSEVNLKIIPNQSYIKESMCMV